MENIGKDHRSDDPLKASEELELLRPLRVLSSRTRRSAASAEFSDTKVLDVVTRSKAAIHQKRQPRSQHQSRRDTTGYRNFRCPALFSPTCGSENGTAFFPENHFPVGLLGFSAYSKIKKRSCDAPSISTGLSKHL
ncbi:MAG: hypothetical protein RJB11_1778 [Planctomycetota bacterium]